MAVEKKSSKETLKKNTSEGGSMVSSTALAALLDVSSQTIRNLTKDGILTASKRYDRLIYDKDANVTRYVQYLHVQLSSKQRNETASQTEERKRVAEADWKRSRADMAALQLAELEGKMHRSEDVAAVTADIVLSMRALLTALPGRLAMDTAAATSSAEAADIIRAEINRVLDAMSGYRYDPEQYNQRVRARLGWEYTGDGEIDEEGNKDDGAYADAEESDDET